MGCEGVKKGKVVNSNGMELTYGQVMKDIEEDGYKYLGVL